MQVELAKSAGFCFGVQRAVDTVYKQIEENSAEKIYTYGPIIHNEEVIKDMEKKGVEVILSEEELKQIKSGIVIIRSHGVPKRICDLLDENGVRYVDATCPFVKKIHRIVEEKSRDGYHIVIIGNREHPEVMGIEGWAQGPATIIQTEEEARAFELVPESEKVCVVAQTTFNYNKFKDLVEIISEKRYDIIVLNTICNATKERQEEAYDIAKRVDAMIVIGDKRSSNTQKLFEICSNACADTYYIQTLGDLNMNQLRSVETVGITAGASTPNKIIEEVQNNVRINFCMTVKVLKVNDGEGQVLLTYKRLAAEKGNERLKEAYENHEVLKAPVTQILGGGLSVVVDEARVFIPASLVSDTYEKDLSKYQDQEIEFVISEFNPRRNRVIGDRRQLLVAEKAEKQKELFEKLHVGDTVEGVVKNVTDFGAFIDLGGVDGLLHISEMSWGRVENPKKVFKVGDELKVLVKDIHDTKIALSLKFPESNPWANAAEDYAVGTVITGKVARMTDFGAFVELAPGVDALLHVSQISKAHVDKPSDVLKVGEEVTAKIVDLNEAEKKISLSMKALEAADEETADAE